MRRIHLDRQSHYVRARIAMRDRVELDGVTIWRESLRHASDDGLGGPHALVLSDGERKRTGTLKLRVLMAMAIIGAEVEVEGRTLLKD